MTQYGSTSFSNREATRQRLSISRTSTDDENITSNECQLCDNNINNDIEHQQLECPERRDSTSRRRKSRVNNNRGVRRGSYLWRKLKRHSESGELLILEEAGRSNIFNTQHSFDSAASNTDNDDDEDFLSKSSRRELAQAAIQNTIQFTLGQCVAAIIIYLGIAIIAFSFTFENWTIVDSMYFAVVTFTTIGYGDIIPDNFVGRIFTCFFALSGVSFLGIALGVVGTNLMSAHLQALNHAEKIAKKQTITLFSPLGSDDKQEEDENEDNTTNRNASLEVLNNDCKTIDLMSKPEESGTLQLIIGIIRMGGKFLLMLLILLLFAAFFAQDPGIQAHDAFYYTIITATTVGYGDFAPTSQLDRAVAIIFIPIIVGTMGHWLSTVASFIIEQRQNRFQQRLQTYDLSLADIEVMDADSDGNVSYGDFIEFMLVAMNKVDAETFEELRTVFNRLDHDKTGFLSKSDLIATAKKKLYSPRRKLELSQYKKQLLEQARRRETS